MKQVYFEDREFRQQDIESGLARGEYEGCSFTGCDLERADLTGSRFSDCTFTGCNLSNAALGNTALQDVRFAQCKLLGLRFDECAPLLFTVAFDSCALDYSTYTGMKLKGQRFQKCSLRETDFSGAMLSGAQFLQCDLTGAHFEAADLSKADLRTAVNYSIDPRTTDLRKARVSRAAVEGLLASFGLILED